MNDASWPPWVDELARRLGRGEAALYLLHGEVHDLHLHGGKAVGVVELLANTALAACEVVVQFDVAAGVRFLRRREREETLDGLLMERALDKVLAALERLLAEPDVAVIVDHAEAVVPASGEDAESRRARVALRRLALSPEIERRRNPVLLLAERPAALHRSLVEGTRLATLAVPLPAADERGELIRLGAPALAEAAQAAALEERDWIARLARATAGLGRSAIRPLVEARSDGSDRERVLRGLFGDGHRAEERARRIAAMTPFATLEELRETFTVRPSLDELAGTRGRGERDEPDPQSDREHALALLARRRDRALERALGGRVSLPAPDHDLSLVGGADPLRRELGELGRALRDGNASPAVLLAGPAHAGKRWAATALARDAGVPALLLEPGRWRDATADDVAALAAVLDALDGALLLVAHAESLLAPGGLLPAAVAEELVALLRRTGRRGRQMVALTSRRPDLLAAARPGLTVERVLAVLPPRDARQAESMAQAHLKHARLAAEPGLFADPGRGELCRPLVGRVAGDIAAILTRASRLAEPGPIKRAHLTEVARAFLPAADPDEAELSELLAAQCAGDRSLLADRWASLSEEQLAARRTELARRLDRR
jgi:hypothetical protein